MELPRRGGLVESTVGILAVSSQVNTLEKYLVAILVLECTIREDPLNNTRAYFHP